MKKLSSLLAHIMIKKSYDLV